MKAKVQKNRISRTTKTALDKIAKGFRESSVTISPARPESAKSDSTNAIDRFHLAVMEWGQCVREINPHAPTGYPIPSAEHGQFDAFMRAARTPSPDWGRKLAGGGRTRTPRKLMSDFGAFGTELRNAAPAVFELLKKHKLDAMPFTRFLRDANLFRRRDGWPLQKIEAAIDNLRLHVGNDWTESKPVGPTNPPPLARTWTDANSGTHYTFDTDHQFAVWSGFASAEYPVNLSHLCDTVPRWKDQIATSDTATAFIKTLRTWWRGKQRPDIAKRIKLTLNTVQFMLPEKTKR